MNIENQLQEIAIETQLQEIANEVTTIKENVPKVYAAGVADGSGVGEAIENGGEIFNDYENNKAFAPYSHAEGYETSAGTKAFSFKDHEYITDDYNAGNNTGKYYLNTVSGITTGINYTVVLDGNYDYNGKVISVGEDYIEVDNYIIPNQDTLTTIDDDSYILFPDNPEITGDIIIGTSAHAEGYSTYALAVCSHVEGYESKATGKYSHAENRNSIAGGYNSHAEGGAAAYGMSSHAETGATVLKDAEFAHGEGRGSIAGSYNSHAEGGGTQALGAESHSEGYQTIAQGAKSHAEGQESKAYGYISHAEGYLTEAHGGQSHAEGRETTAEGTMSHAEGFKTFAIGDQSHTEGSGTRATGVASHAEGSGNRVDKGLASGNYSHVEGLNCISSGEGAHAEGNNTQSTGGASHSEGQDTIAKGGQSHAEGMGCKALGHMSHAEGYKTTANAHHSHAEGSVTQTTNNAIYSHAEGYNTIADGQAQHVAGKFNISDQTSAVIIGNGTDDANRSNAHTLDWDGNAWFAGDVIAGDLSLQAMQSELELTSAGAQSAYQLANDAYKGMSGKADKTKISYNTVVGERMSYHFASKYNEDIRARQRDEIAFYFDDGEYEDDYISGLSFDSGETPTSIDYFHTGIIQWVGTDCTIDSYVNDEGVTIPVSIFQPSPNTHYEVVFYFNGAQFIGLVNGYKPVAENEPFYADEVV